MGDGRPWTAEITTMDGSKPKYNLPTAEKIAPDQQATMMATIAASSTIAKSPDTKARREKWASRSAAGVDYERAPERIAKEDPIIHPAVNLIQVKPPSRPPMLLADGIMTRMSHCVVHGLISFAGLQGEQSPPLRTAILLISTAGSNHAEIWRKHTMCASACSAEAVAKCTLLTLSESFDLCRAHAMQSVSGAMVLGALLFQLSSFCAMHSALVAACELAAESV